MNRRMRNRMYGGNGMDAPTRNGIDVPKWKLWIGHLIERSVRDEDYDGWD
jgi:hypothetical protein